MLSLILLSYYSGDRIIKVFEKISTVLKSNQIPFELVIIDDGSRDNSYEIASKLEETYDNVSAFQLSKNYTSHYAIFAGLSVCKGNCAMPIPDDEQQPYQTIVDMYRIWESGEKVIIPHRIKRDDGFINDLFSNLYYRLLNNFSQVRFPKGGADSFLIDREIIELINSKIHPINTSTVIEVLRLGYEPYYFPYERVRGTNSKSRWTLKKKIRLFKDTFFSSSTLPIKLISFLGVFFSFFAFALILFYTYLRLIGNKDYWGETMPGWTSTVVIISFFSGLILFSIGVLAEYIWRIYEEVKDRPGFVIKKKKNED